MCISLIGMYISFTAASLQRPHISYPNELCVVLGVLLQYFLLVYFCFTVAESVFLYIKLVIIMGFTIKNYTTKAALIAWSESCIYDYCIVSCSTAVYALSQHQPLLDFMANLPLVFCYIILIFTYLIGDYNLLQ